MDEFNTGPTNKELTQVIKINMRSFPQQQKKYVKKACC